MAHRVITSRAKRYRRMLVMDVSVSSNFDFDSSNTRAPKLSASHARTRSSLATRHVSRVPAFRHRFQPPSSSIWMPSTRDVRCPKRFEPYVTLPPRTQLVRHQTSSIPAPASRRSSRAASSPKAPAESAPPVQPADGVPRPKPPGWTADEIENTRWTSEEDTALKEAVFKFSRSPGTTELVRNTPWGQVKAQMDAAGYAARTVAMCRNRWLRMRADTTDSTRACMVCGVSPTKGHTCAGGTDIARPWGAALMDALGFGSQTVEIKRQMVHVQRPNASGGLDSCVSCQRCSPLEVRITGISEPVQLRVLLVSEDHTPIVLDPDVHREPLIAQGGTATLDPVTGLASFPRLKLGRDSTSSKHDGRRFCWRVEALDALARMALPWLCIVSEPFLVLNTLPRRARPPGAIRTPSTSSSPSTPSTDEGSAALDEHAMRPPQRQWPRSSETMAIERAVTACVLRLITQVEKKQALSKVRSRRSRDEEDAMAVGRGAAESSSAAFAISVPFPSSRSWTTARVGERPLTSRLCVPSSDRVPWESSQVKSSQVPWETIRPPAHPPLMVAPGSRVLMPLPRGLLAAAAGMDGFELECPESLEG